MSKEYYSSHSEKTARNVGVIATLTGIALIAISSFKNSSDNEPAVENNPAILQIDRETCQGDDPSYIPLDHWTINPNEVAPHYETFTGLPEGSDTLGIEWDRSTNQFTVKCLDRTP